MKKKTSKIEEQTAEAKLEAVGLLTPHPGPLPVEGRGKGPAEAGTPYPAAPVAIVQDLRIVKREECKASPTNPRKAFPQAGLEELAVSIRAQGIRQPLIVRARDAEFTLHEPDLARKEWTLMGRDGAEKTFPSENQAIVWAGGEDALKAYYEIVCGERRWRAAGLAGLEEIPVIVQEISDENVVEIQLIENLQRQDLSALEEAESFKELMDCNGYTVERIQERTGKSRSHVFGRLALLKLQPKVRKALENGELAPTIAALIGTVPGKEAQEELLEYATDDYQKPSFRDVQKTIQEDYTRQLKDADFKLDEDVLVKGLSKPVGPCSTCPKRSGNIDGWDGSPNVCTEITCFKQKQDAARELKLDEAELAGRRTIEPMDYGKAQYGTYIKADDYCHADGANGKAFKALAKKAGIEPILTADEDGLVEVFTRADIQKIKEANGIKDYYSNGVSPADRKKKILENKINDAQIAAVVAKCENAGAQGEVIVLLAKATVDCAWSDTMRAVAKRRGWEKDTKAGIKADKLIDAMTVPQAFALLVEILVMQGLRGFLDMNKYSKRAFEFYGVDADQIAKDVKAGKVVELPGAKFEREAKENEVKAGQKVAAKRWEKVKAAAKKKGKK